jgi:hypothetical protein
MALVRGHLGLLVRTFIVLAGDFRRRKSTAAAILQRKLGMPLSEFGWIPEFRNTGTRVAYEEDVCPRRRSPAAPGTASPSC